MRRVISDALISACALGVLLIALVAMDGHVREQVAMSMDSTRASTELAATGAQARKLGGVVIQIVKDQSQQHGPLMIMVVVGTVLTLVMFRT
jgi:hypothetical protein